MNIHFWNNLNTFFLKKIIAQITDIAWNFICNTKELGLLFKLYSQSLGKKWFPEIVVSGPATSQTTITTTPKKTCNLSVVSEGKVKKGWKRNKSIARRKSTKLLHYYPISFKKCLLLQRHQHNQRHKTKASTKEFIQSCFADVKQLLQATYPLLTAHRIEALWHQQPYIFHRRSCRFHKKVHRYLAGSHLEVCSKVPDFVISIWKSWGMLLLLPWFTGKSNSFSKLSCHVNLILHKTKHQKTTTSSVLS